MMPDEQVAVLEQVRHPLLLPLGLTRQRLLLFAGPATRQLGDLRRQFLAEYRQSVQDRLGDLLDDVELAQLLAGIRPQLLEYIGVKRRTIRGDAVNFQAAFVQLFLELLQKSADVL